ncbi:hypothetical protein C823_006076 [Eubacterium plexicaudatum ASF492]|nr:hypothetical protein C823_006076 [Eubacterium plexicaudatum ASF492]
MNINNPKFNAPVTFNEYHSAPELAKIQQIIEDQSAEHYELCEKLRNWLILLSQEKESMRNHASDIIKNVGGGTLANILGGSILAFIRDLSCI